MVLIKCACRFGVAAIATVLLGGFAMPQSLNNTLSPMLLAEGEEPVLQVPTSLEVIRSIVSIGDVEESADLDELLDQGTVEKRTGPVRVFFAYSEIADAEHAQRLLLEQVEPLFSSISSASGLTFEMVPNLSQANTLIIFSERSSAGLTTIGRSELINWFGEPEEEMQPVLKTFGINTGKCFRFISSPGGEIRRAVGFVSSDLSPMEQETCVARNLLFSVGLRGPGTGQTAKDPRHTARGIGLLDAFGLAILYHPSTRPGMTLRAATAPASSN